MSPDGLEQRIKTLREEVDSHQQGKARADHEAAVARAQEEAAKKALYDEFSVSSIEEARADLARVDADLASACEQAERELKSAGG